MKTLREYIDLLETIDQQPVKSGAEIAASVAPYVDDLENMEVKLKEEELDEINWRKGLAGVAAAGALALGASPAQAEDMTECMAVYKIASITAANNNNPQAARAFDQAFYNTGKLLNGQFERSEMDSIANRYSSIAMNKINQQGLANTVKNCNTTIQNTKQRYGIN